MLYFFCHAKSVFPDIDNSCVELSDGIVSIRDMKIHAPTVSPKFEQAPLVFLNACQSARLNPYLYDGLAPYLIDKGARGLIGTEVDTPAYFAAEFGQELLSRFAAGEWSIGELLLLLRREYLEQKNNILGLIYTLYGSADITICRKEIAAEDVW